VHIKEKKPKKAAAAAAGRGGKPGPGFTDANASWLKPKAAPARSKAATRVAAAKAAEIRAAEEEGGYSSDSEDAPLPGELSGSDGDQMGLMSDSEDGSEGAPSSGRLHAGRSTACRPMA
jgi:hypothetical protein